MYSLFIDTHDKNVIVILFKDGKILCKEENVSNNKHSEITMPVIAKIFKENKLDIKDLNNVIVVNGPGSFTGERIAVTIGKTIAYCLKIPIRAIDSLSIMAINVEEDKKIVALEDRNGAYVGEFNKDNEKLCEFKYLSNSLYNEYKSTNKVINDVDIDYEKVYEFAMKMKDLNPHEVKPLYVKGISALDDKKC